MQTSPQASKPLTLGRLAPQVQKQLAIVAVIAVVWLALLLVIACGQAQQTEPPGTATGPVTWDDTIGPLFAQHCTGCHGVSSGLSLESYEGAIKGGARGPAIVPGDGGNSLLVRALKGQYPGLPRMPWGRPSLSKEAIQRVLGWIDSGAPRSAADVKP